MTQRIDVRDLVRMALHDEARILESGAFVLNTGELYTSQGRLTEHGASGRINHRCDCDTCVLGAREAWRSNSGRRRARKPLPHPDPWANVRSRRDEVSA